MIATKLTAKGRINKGELVSMTGDVVSAAIWNTETVANTTHLKRHSSKVKCLYCGQLRSPVETCLGCGAGLPGLGYNLVGEDGREELIFGIVGASEIGETTHLGF